MATVNYYLSRFIKNDDERGEIQLRFSGNRNFVKRAPTGIFITAGNWDQERGMPKVKRVNRFGDNCDEIRDRLNLMTSFLLRCWEETSAGELKPDTLTNWLDDIEWSTDQEVVYINGKPTAINIWKVDSKARMAAEAAMQKREVPEINHTVTILDPVTRLEKQVKLSEVASSHMGRRNFCGNLYDAGFRETDIAAMSGHSEGSKAIARYRKVSDETKQRMIDSL